jgi:hypothetical protein
MYRNAKALAEGGGFFDVAHDAIDVWEEIHQVLVVLEDPIAGGQVEKQRLAGFLAVLSQQVQGLCARTKEVARRVNVLRGLYRSLITGTRAIPSTS